MEYTTLTGTGMKVSRICLGCWSFGLDSSEKEEWSLGESESKAIIDRAIDLGINFFDTANSYSWGDSERVLGDALSEYDRKNQVVATKVYNAPSADPGLHETGLSRKTIEQELKASLDRLGMDEVDLYQIHRWDDETPVRETLDALDDQVHRGTVRYIGASSMWTHQFAEAHRYSRSNDLERFVTMQNHYNLVYREEEREMIPYCESNDIGIIPWSPLAQGYLAKPHQSFDSTNRGSAASDQLSIYHTEAGRQINERVKEIAEEKGVTMAQIAIAWHLHKEFIDAPIIGTTSIEHLEEAVEALDISLSGSEVAYLEEPYRPKQVHGHS